MLTPQDTTLADVIVIGAGIAGASLAWWLVQSEAGDAPPRVIVLERESQPGYHSTGRSAAQYIATYGTPQVRALTLASRAFLERPPEGFTDQPLLRRRATLTVGLAGHEALLDKAWAVLRSVTDSGERLDAASACARVPVLRREAVIGAIHEPESWDMDVHALHQGYLRGMKRGGGKVLCDAEVCAIERDEANDATGSGPLWRVTTRDGRHFAAPVLVNATGAWCDLLARLAGVAPIGLVPRRRSAFLFKPPAELPAAEVAAWPLVIAADQSWYFKPDAGLLFGSPANADATEPQDVQPEQIDIATGAWAIEQATTMTVQPLRSWAGLRSFVADGDLVGGWAPDAPGFFWCAAQGGYGIQTSAAMGQACAALVLGQTLPEPLRRCGIDAAMLSPARAGLLQRSPR
jgi:D-arginine dehydrogenase